ncbi:M4 family metallopeptidase [Nocardia sp. alder85J]|uniref:M4 family metallopeptidase n=1 Tax=Nocardia sp. alder85J TaxID=2862949 RepID=UPI001CD6CB84|nr:M4 family metallopeptidase [Nocardia sp. alder85J]MCX4095283.1 M4 family metallopeptidase [Nocardia sp. alder85J]
MRSTALARLAVPIRLAVLAGLVAALLAVPTVTATAQPAPSLLNSPKTIHRNSGGSVRQVVLDAPVPAPGGASGDPGRAAIAHAGDVAQLFGSRVAAALTVDRVSRRGTGNTVRLTQSVDAIPVYGGGVALALKADGALLSATGALAEQTAGAFPAGAAAPTAAARGAALAEAAELAKAEAAAVRVRSEAPTWYDPGLSGSGRSEHAARPAYRFDLAVGDGAWRVFVAATDSRTVLDAWKTEESVLRVICDADSGGDEIRLDIPCGGVGSYPVVRTEGGPPVTDENDANQVYDWIGDTDAFYRRYTGLDDLTRFIGIDARDSNGTALRAVVRVCVTTCPYQNAYWSDGVGFVIGAPVLAIDVVAHELTHGVTEKTSGLDYLNESGAINESMSDIFGEFTELTTERIPHDPKDRWKVGNGTEVGVIRDMRSPSTGPGHQPEIYRGPGWVPATYSDHNRVPDRGGAHTNSGVGNKLAYLITDGDTFNGRTIRGLGIRKAAALYWTVQNQLYPSADYPALAATLMTACRDAVVDILAGLTTADCTQVQTAIAAVQIPVAAEKA